MPSTIPPHAGQSVVTSGPPLGEARVAVVMVHGRNAAPKNILDLAPAFAHPDVAYVAPGAAGGSWYPFGFMSPIEQNEPGITSAIAVLHGLVDDIVAKGIPTERIVLLGFSQGACLVSTAAQRRPAKYGGVVVYSGGLIGPPGTVWRDQGTFAGTPVFLGCSNIDSHIPEERVRASAGVFERMAASVTLRIYEGMGHAVNEDEITFTRELLTTLASA